jgi:hypothetical protein
MAIESPRYRVVQKDNKFEIREYDGYILAEVEIDGDFSSALQKGFRVLADYIFGGNTSKAHIAMTVISLFGNVVNIIINDKLNGFFPCYNYNFPVIGTGYFTHANSPCYIIKTKYAL